MGLKLRSQTDLEAAAGAGPEKQYDRVWPMKALLIPADQVGTELWVKPEEFDYREDARMCTTGNRMLPWPVGTIRAWDSRQRLVVHDEKGPACSAKWPGKHPVGPGGTLIRQVGGPSHGVRSLLPEEVWRIQGGDRSAWAEGDTPGENTALRMAVQALPPKSAAAMLTWAESLRQSTPRQTEARAGGCPDPREVSAWQATRRWLYAWASHPQQPSLGLVEDEKTGGLTRDGSESRRRKKPNERGKAWRGGEGKVGPSPGRVRRRGRLP